MYVSTRICRCGERDATDEEEEAKTDSCRVVVAGLFLSLETEHTNIQARAHVSAYVYVNKNVYIYIFLFMSF